jgi:hypothetical protein
MLAVRICPDYSIEDGWGDRRRKSQKMRSVIHKLMDKIVYRRVSTTLNAQAEDFRGLSLRRERSVERGVVAGFPSGNPSPM